MKTAKPSATPPKETENRTVGRRLMILRYATGFGGHGGTTKFAEKYGFTLKQWSGYEKGSKNMPREDVARLLAQIPGLSSDWLLFGIIDTTTFRMRRELEQGEADLLADKGGRNGRRRTSRRSH